ncbi:MAG: hypothetical protein KatS3mg105_0352 [Gemmatales bacterium]|nr:MAG: hypothetical protein KatS3mg105_0352 [Gemmatales bacterium]
MLNLFIWRYRINVLAVLGLLFLVVPAVPQRLVTESDKLTNEEREIFRSLRDGRTQYAPELHKKIIERAARWYVGRVTWKEIQENSLKGNPSPLVLTLSDIVREAQTYLLPPNKLNPDKKKRESQLVFLREYGNACIAEIEKVLQNPNAIARINAARILAWLGTTGQEEHAAAMVKVIEDPGQHDAVKLWALIGLKDMFTTIGRFKNKELEAKCLQAVVRFVERKPNYPPNASKEEIDGFRYVRREGTRVLAAAAVPSFTLDDKIAGRPALVLLRILSNDGIDPPALIRERTEAAIGLCRMDPKLDPAYHPDFAALHIGYFLADFGIAHGNDQKAEFKSEAWRVLAIRLHAALEEFKTNTKDPYVAQVVDKGLLILTDMETGKPAQDVHLRDMRAWLGMNQPPHKQLFEGVAESAVKLPSFK